MNSKFGRMITNIINIAQQKQYMMVSGIRWRASVVLEQDKDIQTGMKSKISIIIILLQCHPYHIG